MRPDISVIVPVYQVEPYLRSCLDSLIEQTKKEIEIIVIDDGSPDQCGLICDEYAAKDERLRVIHQEHLGLSAARNAGIDAASADWVMFVDSDDWVQPSFCETPFRLALENSADIVMFEYDRFKDHRIVSPPSPEMTEGMISFREACVLSYSSGDYCWNKLCKKLLFKGIRFPEGRVCEDIAVTYLLFLRTCKIYYTPEKLYHYRYRLGSIVTTMTQKLRIDNYDMNRLKIHALSAISETKDIAALQLLRLSLTYCIAFSQNNTDYRWVESASELMNRKPKIPTIFTWKEKVLIILFWYCRWFFDFLCIAKKKRLV